MLISFTYTPPLEPNLQCTFGMCDNDEHIEEFWKDYDVKVESPKYGVFYSTDTNTRVCLFHFKKIDEVAFVQACNKASAEGYCPSNKDYLAMKNQLRLDGIKDEIKTDETKDGYEEVINVLTIANKLPKLQLPENTKFKPGDKVEIVLRKIGTEEL